MKEVVVIEESDDGTSGGPDPVGDHRAPPRLLREHPSSATIPHLALEIFVVEVRNNDQFDWGFATNFDRAKGFAKELPPAPSGHDHRDGLVYGVVIRKQL